MSDEQEAVDGTDSLKTLIDGDGLSDSQESHYGANPLVADMEGDGNTDSNDEFRSGATKTVVTESGGIGNNADADDNDDVADSIDAFPLDGTATSDSDADGVGDNSDAFPLNSHYSTDTDNDGMPNTWELKYGLNPNDPSDATSDQDNDGANALAEFLAGTIPAGSIDIDGNGKYEALTDGLLLLRGMFGLTGDALIGGAVASDAVYTTSVDIEARIAMLGTLADIDGNGDVSALTDDLLALRYLFSLTGDALISGVIASDATTTTSAEIEAPIQSLTPAL